MGVTGLACAWAVCLLCHSSGRSLAVAGCAQKTPMVLWAPTLEQVLGCHLQCTQCEEKQVKPSVVERQLMLWTLQRLECVHGILLEVCAVMCSSCCRLSTSTATATV